MTTLTQAQLCRVWQKRLRLMDWKVTLSLTTFEDPTQYADNEWDEEACTAQISLRGDLEGLELEDTIVHELLHLRLSDLTTEDMEYGDPRLEKAVKHLCDCFLQAYPHRRKKEPNVQN